MKARDINDTIRYTMWSVFRQTRPLDDPPEEVEVRTLQTIRRSAGPGGDDNDGDLVIRGWYDVAGLRADADLMVWWHAPTAGALQDAYHALRRSPLGRFVEPVWSQLGLHRPAEFNKGHVPAFMAGEEPRAHLCVYPFVRSYEWYLLPEEDRRAMLAEHGMLARPYPGRPGEHGVLVRPRRLRVAAGLRGRRAASDRGPDARTPRGRRPSAHPRGGAVLHRAPARAQGDPAVLVVRQPVVYSAGSRLSDTELMQ